LSHVSQEDLTKSNDTSKLPHKRGTYYSYTILLGSANVDFFLGLLNDDLSPGFQPYVDSEMTN